MAENRSGSYRSAPRARSSLRSLSMAAAPVDPDRREPKVFNFYETVCIEPGEHARKTAVFEQLSSAARENSGLSIAYSAAGSVGSGQKYSPTIADSIL